MDKLPKNLSEKQNFWKRLLLLGIALAVIAYYLPEILQILVGLLGICFPFIIGGLLAFVLNTLSHTLIRWVEKLTKKSINPKHLNWYKTLTLLLLVAVVVIFAFVIIPEMVNSFRMLITQLPVFLTNLEIWLQNLGTRFSFLSSWAADNEQLVSQVPEMLDQVVTFLTSGGLGSAISSIFDTLSNTFSSVWTGFLSVMFALISFYNSKRLADEARLILMGFFNEKIYLRVESVARLSASVFASYISGTLIDGLILGTLVVVVNFIFGIPYALLTGMICGFFALVPLFGGIFSEVLCTLLIVIVDPLKGLLFFVMFLILQQIDDNIIYPSVVGKSTGLPNIYVLVAVTIGAGVAGFVGMLISIPVTTVIYDLVQQAAIKRLKTRNYPEQEKERLIEEFNH